MCTTSIKKLKGPKTYEEQLDLLKNRGLIIKDEKHALHILKRTNYYRLSAYMLTYKDSRNEFAPGTYFEEIYRLYEFDRKLRNKLHQYDYYQPTTHVEACVLLVKTSINEV